jgi:hypothetical protein
MVYQNRNTQIGIFIYLPARILFIQMTAFEILYFLKIYNLTEHDLHPITT